MKLIAAAVVGIPWVVMSPGRAAAATQWWDIDGTTAGAGGATPSGTWSTGAANWNTDNTGGATGTVSGWVAGNDARFSAGTNATGAFTVTVSGTVSVDQIGLEDGTPTFTGGTLTLGAGVSGSNVLLSVNSNATNATINSVIAGTSGLKIGRNTTGGGTITIGNTSNSFTGGVSVTSIATLKLGAANVIPDANVVTLNGGALDLNGFGETVAGLVSGTASSNVLLGAGTLTLAGSGSSSYFGNDITGTGGIVLKSGTQVLSTNYGYTGPTTITGGILKVDSLRNAGSSSSIGASTTANAAGNLVLNGGTLMWVGKTTLVGTAGNSTNRNYTLGANGGTIDSSGPDAVTFSGNMTVDSALTSGTQTFALTGTGTGTISGTINDGGGTNKTALTKSGTGTWTLTNSANTYGGDTTISTGTLVITGNSTLGDGTGTLKLSGGTLSTTATRTASSAPIPNPLSLTASSTVTTTSNGATVDLNFSSNSISGSGGTLTFTNGGTGSFQPRFSGNGFTFSRPIVLDNGTGTTVLQSFNGSGTSQSFSGAISGSGSYKRTVSSGSGGDTFFSGANTYTGTTTVNAGGLWVNGSHTGGDNYTVSSGGTLGGSGTITLANGKSVTATGTGAISPGSAAGQVGTLKVGGTGTSVVMNGGKLGVDLSGDSVDLLDVVGTLTVNTGSTLAITDSGSHTQGLYKVADYAARNGTGGSGAGKFDTVTGLNSNFLLLYNANEIDLQQKAKIGAVSSPAVTVIKGGVTAVSILVGNSSPTGSAALSFSETNLGPGLTGLGAGTAAAQATGTGTLSFNSAGVTGATYTPGFTVTGDVNTTQGGDVNGSASVTVLEHSNASFDGAGNKAIHIDFGTVTVGANGGATSSSFDIFNDVAVAGFTAGLDLDQVVSTGDVGTLSVSGPAAFSALAAGGSKNYSVVFDTTSLGTFSATYTFKLSDEDLVGATAAGSDVITLNVSGKVVAPVPLPAAGWMGLGLLGGIGAVRRLRRARAV